MFTVMAILVTASLLLIRKIISDNIESQLTNYATVVELLIEKNSNNYYFQNEQISYHSENKTIETHFINLPADVILFNQDFSIIISADSGIMKHDANINPIYFYRLFDSEEALNGFYTQSMWLNENMNNQSAYLKYLSEIDLFLIVSKPREILFKEIGNYLPMLLMIFVFLLIVSTYSIFRVNSKYIGPYAKIIASLNKNKYVKASYNAKASEPAFIVKSIQMLSNQLDFYAKKLEISNKENSKIENDLQIAKKLQANILPKQSKEIEQTEKISVSASSEAAYEIGGDLYDFFMLGKNKVLFAVGDVSGKGIPAALFMIYTQTLLRSVAQPGESVSQIVEKLNNKLTEDNISDLFVTMLLGIIDLDSGKVSYCNAAHNYPIIIKHEGTIDEITETHGIPLGIYANRQYSTLEIQLKNNDQLFIYTDGIIDSKDENGMNYTVDVLKYNLMGGWFLTTEELQDKIKNSLNSFRGNVLPADDVTMMVIKYTGREN